MTEVPIHQLVDVDDDLAQVVSWRLKVLLDAGYPILDAERIARTLRVDLHHAVALVASGCSPETATRILL